MNAKGLVILNKFESRNEVAMIASSGTHVLHSRCSSTHNYKSGICQQTSRPVRAFTLIELLVVIAIISILATILLPALDTAKDMARTAACMSNIRSHVIGLNVYASDNDGSFPPSISYPLTLQADTGSPGAFFWTTTGLITPRLFVSWMDFISDGQGAKPFQCPSAGGDVISLDEARSRTWDGTSNEQGYGYSIKLSRHNMWSPDPPSPLRVSDVAQPAQSFAVMDYPRVYGTYAQLGEYYRYGTRFGSYGPPYYVAPHDDYTNFGIVDGHAETIHWTADKAIGPNNYWRGQ